MNLHPDISFALAGFPPAQRAGAQGVLAGLGIASVPGQSTLTGDGFPFELSFTTADDDLRWTCELNCAGTAQDRMVQTSRIYAGLGGSLSLPLPAPRRFGAWLGGRHKRDGQSSYKLYLDPGTAAPPPSAPLPADDVAGFRPSLRMIGVGPDPERREYYYRFQSGNSHLLRRLASVAGLGHRAGDLMDILRAQAGRGPDDLLLRGAIGVSFAYAGPDAAPQMTLYLFARTLWGSDAVIRRAFLRILDSAGRNPDAYAAATAPLHDLRRSCTWHGMVALTMTDTHHGWGIGLRPIKHIALIADKRTSTCPIPSPC